MPGIKKFVEEVQEFVNSHDDTDLTMSDHNIKTVLKDVYAEHGEFGKAIAKEYITQQLNSY
tara:strand:- start:27413 stop:27595 length:183 start_codon:yes stop_codon:yes gene_type:complete